MRRKSSTPGRGVTATTCVTALVMASRAVRAMNRSNHAAACASGMKALGADGALATVLAPGSGMGMDRGGRSSYGLGRYRLTGSLLGKAMMYVCLPFLTMCLATPRRSGRLVPVMGGLG